MYYVTPLLLTMFLSLILPLSHTTLNYLIHSKFEAAKVYFIQLEWADQSQTISHFFPHTQPIWLSNSSPKCDIGTVELRSTLLGFQGVFHCMSKTCQNLCYLKFVKVEKLGSLVNYFLPSKISQSQLPQTIRYRLSCNRDGYTPSQFIPSR